MTFNNAINVPKLVSDGQILIGSAGINPVATTITPGSGISITNNPGQIIISASSVGSLVINQNSLQFTAPGTYTYTPSPGLVYAFVQVLGGGGAGGGSTNSGPVDFCAGGGGGGGGYTEAFIDAATIGVSQTVTVGAGGVGVVSNDGGDGTTSSFGALLIGNEGLGGTFGSAQQNFAAGGGGGGAAGTSFLYYYAGETGGSGGPGSGTIASEIPPYSYAGNGGSCFTGYAQEGEKWTVLLGSQANNGITATEPGVGGTGGFSAMGSAPTFGGDGAPGFVFITEYILS